MDLKKILRNRILLCAVAMVLIIVATFALRRQHAHNKIAKLQEETAVDGVQEDKGAILSELGIAVPDKKIAWKKLKKENEDIYAWIYIPNTNVDYPILQHPTDDTYYLRRTVDGKKADEGSIYTELLNAKDFSDPMTVIYGHNIYTEGTMFHQLHYFEDGEFFEKNPYIFIYTPKETFAYEIFAAYTFSDAHLLMSFDFITPESFDYYVQSTLDQRDMNVKLRKNIPVSMKAGSHLITLSTCNGHNEPTRFLVQAVLLNDPYQ